MIKLHKTGIGGKVFNWIIYVVKKMQEAEMWGKEWGVKFSVEISKMMIFSRKKEKMII